MWGDLNSLGIVFYPRYNEWIDGSSHLFFEKIDLELTELWNKCQLIFSFVNTSCEYLRPGRYHQEICITTHIARIERKTITLNHIIADKPTSTIMVKCVEKRICVGVQDLNNLKAIDISEKILTILNKAF